MSVPENLRLKRGTGSYSTPFRGSLFGETESAKIDATLQHMSVDVLWMGSNPNVPQSLQAILDGDAHPAAYETFALQRKCGMFSEQLFIDGHSSRGWDPIHYPAQRGWQFYSRLFASVGKLERVAMANFVVWGSRTFDELLSKLFESMPTSCAVLLSSPLRKTEKSCSGFGAPTSWCHSVSARIEGFKG